MIYHNIEKLKYNYNKLLASGLGLANSVIVSASKNTSKINLFMYQTSIPDYHKIMFDNQNTSSYHIAGYGQTIEESLTRTLGETVERYSFMSLYHLLKDNIIKESYSELEKKAKVIPLDLINVVNSEDKYFKQLDKDAEIEWLLLKNYITNEDIYVPFFMIGSNKNKNISLPAMSTGTATHISQQKALINAFTEAFQLDAFMNAWYGSKKLKKIDITKIKSKEFNIVLEKTFKKIDNLEIIVLENPFRNTKFKNFITIIKSKENKYPYCSVGIQGGLNYEYAIIRSIMEAAAIFMNLQAFYIYEYDKINNLTLQNTKESYNLDDTFLYWSNYNDKKSKDNKLNSIISDEYTIVDNINYSENDELKELLEIAKKELYYLSILDITPLELKKYGYSTIRIIAPELLPMCFPALPYLNHPNFPKGGENDLFPHPLP